MAYQPLQRPYTHQKIIHKIKQRLSLPHLQSSFISRESILSYIRLLHNETIDVEEALNPKSLQPQIEAKQIQCSRLRELLCEKQKEEIFLKARLRKLQQDLSFSRQYNLKSIAQCQVIEKQIANILQEHSISIHSQQQPVEMLMDKFLSYFEDPQGQVLSKKNTKTIQQPDFMKKPQKKSKKKQERQKSQKRKSSEKKKNRNFDQKSEKSEKKSKQPKSQQKMAQPSQPVIYQAMTQFALHHPQLQIVNYTYTGFEQQNQIHQTI